MDENLKKSSDNTDKTDKDSSIEEENKIQNLNEKEDISFSYSQILKDAGKQSLKAIRIFLFVILLFGIVNILFIVYDSFYINESRFKSLIVLLSLLFASVCIPLALSTTYRFLIIDTLSIVYKYLTDFFKRICIKVIDMVVAGGNKISGKDINKSINVGALMIEVYGSKAPKYVQKGLVFIINKIPFSDFLKQMQKDLSERKSNKILSEILYEYLHNYIVSIFQNNSMSFIYTVLIINIVLQIGIIYLFK